HTWLPDAHTEAPTAGSVILAGVMLKLGTYGFLRFGLYLFPEATVYFAPLLLTLGTIGILYAAVVATMQKDL
ncbi:MAG: Fe-S-binding domain-containing protein, partial [Acidimicrobiales bacterium]|nr:Fe-S-binding domain-containing protein [Acidimicrobiales bacterium]